MVLRDGGVRPAPELRARYSLELDYEQPLHALLVLNGETFEAPLDSESLSGHRDWLALVCSRANEIAVEQDSPPLRGYLKDLRLVDGQWQVIAEKETWVQ